MIYKLSCGCTFVTPTAVTRQPTYVTNIRVRIHTFYFCGALTRFRVMAYPSGASRSHSLDTLQSVGLLLTSDLRDAETTHSTHKRQTPNVPAGIELTIPARQWLQTYVFGYGYTGVRNDTTQQSGQTPDKELDIKNITVYVSDYTETETTGMLSPTTVWRQQREFVLSRPSGQIPAAVRTGSKCSCDGHNASNRTC